MFTNVLELQETLELKNNILEEEDPLLILIVDEQT